MEYIKKHGIYIHVHFLTIGETSLIDALFSDASQINKDNKLAFLRYIEGQSTLTICRSCTKFKTQLLKESIKRGLNVQKYFDNFYFEVPTMFDFQIGEEVIFL